PDGWTTPPVKGKAQPRIEGRRVPTGKKGPKGEQLPGRDASGRVIGMDIEHLVKRPGEGQRDAMRRVETVWGRLLIETPLANLWEQARKEVQGERQMKGISKLEADKLYNKTRDRFWELCRNDEAAT